jgi:hypothetical protein
MFWNRNEIEEIEALKESNNKCREYIEELKKELRSHYADEVKKDKEARNKVLYESWGECAKLKNDVYKLEKNLGIANKQIEILRQDGIMENKERSKAIVNKIIADLSNRGGLSQEWKNIDDETKEEIIQVWINIVVKG